MHRKIYILLFIFAACNGATYPVWSENSKVPGAYIKSGPYPIVAVGFNGQTGNFGPQVQTGSLAQVQGSSPQIAAVTPEKVVETNTAKPTQTFIYHPEVAQPYQPISTSGLINNNENQNSASSQSIQTPGLTYVPLTQTQYNQHNLLGYQFPPNFNSHPSAVSFTQNAPGYESAVASASNGQYGSAISSAHNIGGYQSAISSAQGNQGKGLSSAIATAQNGYQSSSAQSQQNGNSLASSYNAPGIQSAYSQAINN